MAGRDLSKKIGPIDRAQSRLKMAFQNFIVSMLARGRAFLLLEFHKFQFVSGYSSPSFAVGDFDIHNIRADLRWTCFNRNDLQKYAKQIDK
jgi:hypothetical protein